MVNNVVHENMFLQISDLENRRCGSRSCQCMTPPMAPRQTGGGLRNPSTPSRTPTARGNSPRGSAANVARRPRTAKRCPPTR
eukprot:8302233-Lingulodinium_polyedra.AAC.1